MDMIDTDPEKWDNSLLVYRIGLDLVDGANDDLKQDKKRRYSNYNDDTMIVRR